MTFVANSQGITITDTNNTTVFSTARGMPHIVASTQGSLQLPLVPVEGYAQSIFTNCTVETYRIFTAQFASNLFEITGVNSDGFDVDIDLIAANFFPQVFVRLTNAGGIGIVPGINGRWMLITGGMLVRAYAGSNNLTLTMNPPINSLCGAETLDCIITPRWVTLDFQATFNNNSTVVDPISAPGDIRNLFAAGDIISNVADGTATSYTVASVSATQIFLTTPYTGTTKTSALMKYKKNQLQLVRVYTVDGHYGRTNPLGPIGHWGETPSFTIPCSYLSGGRYVGPSPLFNRFVTGTNYTVEYKIVICKL